MIVEPGAVEAPDASSSASIEFFSIQLSAEPDGRFYIGIEATVCCDCELAQMDLGHHGVSSIDDALDVIRTVVTAH